MMEKQSRWNDTIFLVALAVGLAIMSGAFILGGYWLMEIGRFLSQMHLDIGKAVFVLGHTTLIAALVIVLKIAINQFQSN